MFRLGKYYENEEEDYDLMLKYYGLCLENNDLKPDNSLSEYFSNDLKYYNWLNSLNNKNDTISNIITRLSESDKVKEYLNKIENNLSNIKKCIVCYDTDIHIGLYCGHEICSNCYCKVNMCYYRCKINSEFL